MNADSAIELISYREDPLLKLVQLLLDRHRNALPDLSRLVVLIPASGELPRLRRLLCDCARELGHSALLPPWTGTLAAWLRNFADPDYASMGVVARELALLESLQGFPEIRRQFGTWPLVDSLFALFDELTLNQRELPATPEALRSLLTQGYGISADALAPLADEAQWVHALWIAWQKYLQENRLLDDAGGRVTALVRSAKTNSGRFAHIYLAGFVDLARAEIAWIKTLLTQGNLTLVLQGHAGPEGYHPDSRVTALLRELGYEQDPRSTADAYSLLIDTAYQLDGPDLPTRAQEFARAQPINPAHARLVLHGARDLECEARAIELQIRRWRLSGLQDIGIVTNDRKLARRVRALLERANIQVTDTVGWPLSTTSAATALMRWLECLEHQFEHGTLLDLLKSPFVTLGMEQSDLRVAVLRFEQEIVRFRNVASGLQNYRAAAARVNSSKRETGEITASHLIDALYKAAEPLLDRIHVSALRPVEFLDSLLTSLARLGMIETCEHDDAGIAVLTALDELRSGLAERSLQMSWREFHFWLQRDLERRRFNPPGLPEPVRLMNLADSRASHFDAVIIAGCTREHLPGAPGGGPFFNDRVRYVLGLPPLWQKAAQEFYDFRRLLGAAPVVMVTRSLEHEGEMLVATPWVERLGAFVRLAYGSALEDETLAALVESEHTLLALHDAPLPSVSRRTAVTLPPQSAPSVLTAGAHQRLLDCPYQFYAIDLLGIVPTDTVREELEKSDFGRHVHRMLQAFHSGVQGLPGPWQGDLNTDSLAAAEELLVKIAEKIFAPAMALSFSARAWYYRIRALIPTYLRWQLARSRHWRTGPTEVKAERLVTQGDLAITLTGRIDRIDERAGRLSVIDYKTGRLPAVEDVACAEHTQLAFYALLLDAPVDEVLYLALEKEKIGDAVKLEGVALADVVTAVRGRLMSMLASLQTGTTLTAWGDDDVCRLCAVEGVCRKQMWLDPAAGIHDLPN